MVNFAFVAEKKTPAAFGILSTVSPSSTTSRGSSSPENAGNTRTSSAGLATAIPTVSVPPVAMLNSQELPEPA